MKTTIEKDDWLQKELEYENRINVWHFDDSRYFLQKMHEDDCNADKNRIVHEKLHNSHKAAQSTSLNNRNMTSFVTGFVFLIVFFLITAIAASFDLDFLLTPLVLLFPILFVAVILNTIRSIRR